MYEAPPAQLTAGQAMPPAAPAGNASAPPQQKDDYNESRGGAIGNESYAEYAFEETYSAVGAEQDPGNAASFDC